VEVVVADSHHQVELVLLSVVVVAVEVAVVLHHLLWRLLQVKHYQLQLEQLVLLEMLAVDVQAVQAVRAVYLEYYEVLQY
jgi:hypothetical protein